MVRLHQSAVSSLSAVVESDPLAKNLSVKKIF
jgi:hypothetical protein